MKSKRSTMRTWIAATLLLIISSVASVGHAESPEEAFTAAQAAFADAKTPSQYLGVAARYQAIIDAGHISSSIYFNQGNAYAAAGDWPRAIASYHRAEKLDPLDADIASNLSLARNKLLLPTAPTESDVVRWLGWPSPGIQAMLLVALATVALVLRSLVLARVIPTSLDRLAHGCLVAGVALLAVVASQWLIWDRSELAVVVQADVPLRRGEATSFPAIPGGALPAGAEVTVLEHRGDWLRVQPSKGLSQEASGWLPRSAVETY